MKTSTALLLTAFLILLGSLAAYNMALKTEYNKGTYKDPYRDFVTVNYRDFDQVQINPATEMNVKIRAGNYKVQVHKNALDFIQIKKDGKNLRVDLVYPQEEQGLGSQELVVITCPQLTRLATNAFYTVKGKTILSTKTWNNSFIPWDDNTVTLEGFKQPNLNLQQDKATAVKLSGNTINRLEAVVGLSTGSTARLHLDKTNTIQEANLDIRNKSELVIENVTIPKRQFQFSDSARATFTGSALGILVQ